MTMNNSSIPARIASVPSDRVALKMAEASLTFGELNERADALAACMVQRGLQPEGIVAICLDRSLEWVVAALAIMRAGGAYLPIDTSWPDERINIVLRDSGVSQLVAPECFMQRVKTTAPALDQKVDAAEIGVAPALAPDTIPLDGLAYMIYTSGSTGVPKGVEVTHANLVHLVEWHNRCFSVSASDRASHLAGLSFDAAGWEIWPYLVAGATVSMVGEMERTSPDLLQRWLLSEKITIAFVPTVLAPTLCELNWPAKTSLRFLLTGGDTLHKRPAAGLPFALVNNYGPTECTVVATSGTVAPGIDSTPSIGVAIDGATVYLLHEDGSAVEPGTVGEIYIGGSGVARGYRNLPQLTAAKFLPDPYSSLPCARMYRTGDRGLRRPDGEIEFRGRTDTQEKIRGQRVELDEISSVLNRHPKLSAALVTTFINDEQEKVLVAYVVPSATAEPTSVELQHFIAEHLPAYMVPASFARLQAFPLTVNGKIDRAALPPIDDCTLLRAVAARTNLLPLEARLLSMVRDLLRTQQVGVADDFFLVGGHSLLGTQLVLRIRSAFGIELSLRHLFQAPTVERLAITVENLMLAQLDDMTDEEAAQQIEVLA